MERDPELAKESVPNVAPAPVENGHSAVDVTENKPLHTMTLLECIPAGWDICNSWAAIAATFALGISQGGNVEVLYGIILILVVMGATTLSLAELSARYPTAGGMYHWTTLLAPKKLRLVLVSFSSSLRKVRTNGLLELHNWLSEHFRLDYYYCGCLHYSTSIDYWTGHLFPSNLRI
jgi:Amino acid permease